MTEKSKTMSLKRYVLYCGLGLAFFLIPNLVLDVIEKKILIISTIGTVIFAIVIWFLTRKHVKKLESELVKPEEMIYRGMVYVGKFLVMFGVFYVYDFLIKVEFAKLEWKHIYFCLYGFVNVAVLIGGGFGLMKFKMWARNVLAVVGSLQVAVFIVILVIGFLDSVKAGVAIFVLSMFSMTGLWLWVGLVFYVFDKKVVNALKIYKNSKQEAFDSSAEWYVHLQTKRSGWFVISLAVVMCLLIFRVFEYTSRGKLVAPTKSVGMSHAATTTNHKYMNMGNDLMAMEELDRILEGKNK